ncbi:hypothetical protein QP519_07255 [Weeksella virosa]|uniref:hypothetical protein n=1 Tax=Weeksella virosa TaxID=1014 RepID=UPI002555AC45|nr:hypothetical protein [Weeksella virosa]MDK7375339.1 hypothetical protein [Weeksella virosa]MDK7676150.1 hypothetical protein [Weeksella virosa]
MSYHQVNNSDKLKNELIDVFNLDEDFISNLLANVSSIKPNIISSNKLILNSSDKEILINKIKTLIMEDFSSTKEDFDLNEFSIQYFFNYYNPIIKMSSFSNELKNLNGGAIIYDIIRIGKYKDEFYLFIPD